MPLDTVRKPFLKQNRKRNRKMYLMHYEKFGDSSKGPSVDDIFSEKEGRGHEIGKMSIRRLWMAPIYIHLYYFLLYSKYQ